VTKLCAAVLVALTLSPFTAPVQLCDFATDAFAASRGARLTASDALATDPAGVEPAADPDLVDPGVLPLAHGPLAAARAAVVAIRIAASRPIEIRAASRLTRAASPPDVLRI